MLVLGKEAEHSTSEIQIARQTRCSNNMKVSNLSHSGL